MVTLVNAKKLAILFARWQLNWTYREIGEYFGFQRQYGHEVVKDFEKMMAEEYPKLLQNNPVQPVP